jgi:BirA family biotin operon repressor/biotin-[acetyl-CoA-carboxylase] ligase
LKVELLDIHAITPKLSGYWRVSISEQTSSTQTDLKTQNPKGWDLIATEFQSAGRGRLDRTFESAKSTGLLFSFFIEPIRKKEDWGFISLIAGAAVARSLNKFTNSSNYSCKWPNDILANDKKIAGLLGEVHESGVVMGIGINITTSSDELPVPTASSVLLESDLVLNRNELLTEICNEFREIFEKWDSGSDLKDYYLSNCSTINKEVRVIGPTGEIQSKAIGITDTGALLLADGAPITVGDLVHLRD